MKKLLLILFVTSISFGQTKEELELCLLAQTNSFSSDTEAENALDRILGVIGASKNFVLTPCSEINNAIATTYKGIRYILYDKAFMRLINSRTNDWSSLTILAHEVGHHINGHSRDLILAAGGVVEPKTLAVRRKQELEADEFAAFIMAKLGAPLNQVESAIALISSDKDDTYSTHPSKSKRLNAIRIGYNKAGGTSRANNDYVVDNSTMSVEQYYNIAYEKYNNEDYYGSISDLNKAIDLNNNFSDAFWLRGNAKENINDKNGALSDYNKAIEINPYAGAYFFNRAMIKYYDKGNKNLALYDLNKTIELLPDHFWAYRFRGIIKFDKKDYYGAISDFTKSIEFSDEIDSSNAQYYGRRGAAKNQIGDVKGACNDYKKAFSLGDKIAGQIFEEDCN